MLRERHKATSAIISLKKKYKMTIEEILGGKTPSQQVTALKIRRYCSPAPNVEELRSLYNPTGHKINDVAYRPNKAIKEEREVPAGVSLPGSIGKKKEKVTVRFEEVNRISLPIQKLIVERTVSFLFANRVKIVSDTTDQNELAVVGAVKVIDFDNKIDSFNRRLCREVCSYKEAAEYWYPVDRPEISSDYGFETSKRLRVALWAPSAGSELYPYYDEYGDMVAFSREYTIIDAEGHERVCFDTYTAEYFYHYEQDSSGWGDPVISPNPIGKIPVVYYAQGQTEYEDVQPLIERLEKLLSNFAETNDYHSSPKIFVTGKILGWAKKAEAGAVIEGDSNAKAQYLSWDHAPEAVKLEIDTLLRMIYSMTQTPDISFEAVKGIGGDFSGVALKLLFMDAHLKGFNKQEIYGEGIQRRISIQKAYIGQMNNALAKSCKEVQIRPEFQLFMIENDKEKTEILVTANGGKAILSQKASIRKASLTEDPESEWDQIQEEADAEAARGNITAALGM